MEAGGRTEESRSTSCRPYSCLQKFMILLTFSLSLLGGLSLSLAGLFKEQLSDSEIDFGEPKHKSIWAASIGLAVVLYSLLGICFFYCSRKYIEKYQLFCSINILLSLTSFIYISMDSYYGETRTFDIETEDMEHIARKGQLRDGVEQVCCEKRSNTLARLSGMRIRSADAHK